MADGSTGYGPKSCMTMTVYLLLLMFTCLLLFLRPLRNENYIVFLLNDQIETNLQILNTLIIKLEF